MNGEALVKECGPLLCKKCRALCQKGLFIRGGFKGSNLLSEFQMGELGKAEEINDVLEAYHRKDKLQYEEQLEFLSAIGREKDIKVHQYSKEELVQLFEPVPKDADGNMDFYLARELITAVRQQRIEKLQQMYPEKDTRVSGKPRAARSGKFATQVNLLDKLNLGQEGKQAYGTRFIARIAASNTHMMAPLHDKNRPELIQNAVLLRIGERIHKDDDWNLSTSLRTKKKKGH
jgi:hypothetical protein